MAKAAEMNPAVARAELARRDAAKAAEKSKLEQAALEENNSQLGTAARLARKGSMKLAGQMSDKYLREAAAAAAGGGKRKKIKSKKRTKRNKQKTKRRKNYTKKNHAKKNRTRKRR